MSVSFFQRKGDFDIKYGDEKENKGDKTGPEPHTGDKIQFKSSIFLQLLPLSQEYVGKDCFVPPSTIQIKLIFFSKSQAKKDFNPVRILKLKI